jgi:uncharacterized protein YbbC (DUF1343 family)
MQAVQGGEEGTSETSFISLYGATAESLHPPAGALDGVDVLVVDLQDVGSRYYTYAVTMRYCMQACAAAGVGVMVLDRPNPINGLGMEGPLLGDGFHSFVGGYTVPVRHGLTIGELATLARQEGIDVDLEVVKMRGWKRSMWFDQTGLPWVLPSPNMPTLQTACVYPGTCLLEATNLSEGRGTTRPFELIGAPWLDGARLADALARAGLAGVRFRPVSFSPVFQKHAGQQCSGVQLHLTDRTSFRPFLAGLEILRAARTQDKARFGWRTEPYEFVSGIPAIDLLTGSPDAREALQGGTPIAALADSWKNELMEFAARRESVLLYPQEGP